MKLINYINNKYPIFDINVIININNIQEYIDKLQKYINSLKKNENNNYCNVKILNENLLNINSIKNIFKEIENDINNEYLIFIYNMDLDFPFPLQSIIDNYNDNTIFNENKQKMLDEMNYKDKIDKDILNIIPKNVKKIYCYSNGISHEKIIMLPIGVDFKGLNFNNNELQILNKTKNIIFDIYKNIDINNKKILCYYNLTLPPINVYHWYGFERQYIYNNIKDKDFILKENCYNHPRIYTIENYCNFYFKLSQSKFMICPRGAGIDTYRMWDCIYFGCIPIIVKYDGYKEFEDLPILFVEKYQDYYELTEEYLNDKWFEMINKNYNYDKIKIDYWKEKIYNDLIKNN